MAECKLLLIAPRIEGRDLSAHIKLITDSSTSLPALKRLVLLSGSYMEGKAIECIPYSIFLQNGLSIFMNDSILRSAEKRVDCNTILNLQFTSGKIFLLPAMSYTEAKVGTTGSPKLAMLTHR